MQNPDVYKPEVKPLQVPVKKNGACNHVGGRPGADGQNVGVLTQPMPYGYYPSPHLYYPIQQQGWPGVALPYGPSTQQMVGPGFQHREPSMPIKSTAKGLPSQIGFNTATIIRIARVQHSACWQKNLRSKGITQLSS